MQIPPRLSPPPACGYPQKTLRSYPQPVLPIGHPPEPQPSSPLPLWTSRGKKGTGFQRSGPETRGPGSPARAWHVRGRCGPLRATGPELQAESSLGSLLGSASYPRGQIPNPPTHGPCTQDSWSYADGDSARWGRGHGTATGGPPEAQAAVRLPQGQASSRLHKATPSTAQFQMARWSFAHNLGHGPRSVFFL